MREYASEVSRGITRSMGSVAYKFKRYVACRFCCEALHGGDVYNKDISDVSLLL